MALRRKEKGKGGGVCRTSIAKWVVGIEPKAFLVISTNPNYSGSFTWCIIVCAQELTDKLE